MIVVTSPLRSLTREKAKRRRKLALWPVGDSYAKPFLPSALTC